MSDTRSIESIAVGERVRQEIGDLTSLIESIRERGLLQPIVVRSDGTLLAGARRLAACKALGHAEVPVFVRDDLEGAVSLLCAEGEENTERLDFAPSEAAALGMKLEELERPRALAREQWAKDPSEKFTEGSKGNTRDKVGKAVGMSGVTYQRAKAVVLAAAEGDRVAIEAREEMDRTGKVTPAYNRVAGVNGSKPVEPTVPFDVTTERRRQLADKARNRVERAVGTCNGLARALGELRLDRAVAVASPEEIAGWDEVFNEARKAVVTLRKRLKEQATE